MKIRKRLALAFTLSAAAILLPVFLLGFYLLNSSGAPLVSYGPSLIALYFIVLLLVYISCRWITGIMLQPAMLKIRELKEITATDLNKRLTMISQDDLSAELTATYNDLLDRLQNSYELQRNFISNASHEIRNPLTAIMGETEVCLEKKRTPEAYIQSLQNIAREADRLDALVDNLLSLAKTEIGDATAAQCEVRLDEVLLEAKASLDKTQPQNQIRLNFEALPANHKWLTIQGNPNLLGIALLNLMENASKFSKNKEVEVTINASQGEIKLSIRDQGIGIPQEELPKILQPFYRARNARSFRGFGIGLSLTDRIIRMHKGNMQISSEEGIGTTFVITFSHV